MDLEKRGGQTRLEERAKQGSRPLKGAGKGRFQILIAYDKLGNGKQGKDACERLLDQVRSQEPQFCAEISALKLRLLDVFPTRREWSLAVSGINLMILSVRGDAPLTKPVQNWISEWLDERPVQSKTILAILNWRRTPHGAASLVQSALKALVKNKKAALFTHHQELFEERDIQAAEDFHPPIIRLPALALDSTATRTQWMQG